jgi:Zn-dependent alcohol dehydrogenase
VVIAVSRTARVAITPADGSIQVETVELPAPGPHDVIVRTIATGICHSQLTDVKMAAAMGRPSALGHEATGTVVEVGEAVTAVAPGDPVFVTWVPRDGGRSSRRPGTPVLARATGADASCHNVFTWADQLVCDEQYVVPLPAGIPTDVAAIIGCAVMTGAGAALNTADVQAGESVVVYGVGGVGISTIVAAVARGATPVIAVDVDDAKLAWAQRQGATHTVNARTEDPVAAIHRITADPERTTFLGTPVSGAHYAFDCIGGDVVAPQLLPSLLHQPYGTSERGTAVLVGIVTLPRLEIDPGDLLMYEKRLAGCLGGSSVPSRDFPMFCDWVRAGQLDLDAIVTRRFALDEVADAAAALERGEITGRAIITFP